MNKFLLKLPAELSHDLVMSILPFAKLLPRKPKHENPIELAGLKFPNKIGLAAGLDKNAKAIPAWDYMGFGFVELGTVTPKPQAGNSKPRLFRRPEHKAIINRMGFNNDGINAVYFRLLRDKSRFNGPVGINLGKNKVTSLDRAGSDYGQGISAFNAIADYLTINISSPNTPGLRDLQQIEQLEPLLFEIKTYREVVADMDGRRAPVFLKLAPEVEQLEQVLALAQKYEIDGFILTNTMASDSCKLPSLPLGGVSGAPLTKVANEVLSRARAIVGASVPLVGVGGIMSKQDAAERLAAGADLLQLYTGFIYHGLDLLRNCQQL